MIRATIGAWALGAAVMTLTCAGAIWRGAYPDPDDILRLLQVRDLLDGQLWWDVDQHRLASGMMHWSRLVDLPLAAVEWPLRAMFGRAVAERAALVVVPLLTLGVVMALAAAVTRRLAGEAAARTALLLSPLTVALVAQMRPMRIDHHGWQVALAMGALLTLLAPRPDARSGAAMGACLAALVTISLEGLPVTAALLGLAALAWAIEPSRARQLVAAGTTLFGAAVLLHLSTRGPHFWTAACDAVSPAWLAMLGVAAGGIALAAAIAPARRDAGGVAVRIALLALAGLGAAATLLAVDPSCTRGPFQMLDPLVRALWYENVTEGLPVWKQQPVWAVICVSLPLVGLYGGARALRAAAPARRAGWWLMLGALAAAFALSVMVSRSAATANAFALPGAAWIVSRLRRRARTVRGPMAPLAVAGALLVGAPGAAAIAVMGMPDTTGGVDETARLKLSGRLPCRDPKDALALGALPRTLVFAPIDVAPELIAATPQRAITSGHHRNARAMADVLTAFTAAPERAEAIVRRYGAGLVAGCPGLPETLLYAHTAPEGLWGRLERGERVAWLRPVSVPGDADGPARVLAWRVLPPERPRP